MTTPHRLDRDWHDQHRMPQHASHDERVRWRHREHEDRCDCRPSPASLETDIVAARAVASRVGGATS